VYVIPIFKKLVCIKVAILQVYHILAETAIGKKFDFTIIKFIFQIMSIQIDF